MSKITVENDGDTISHSELDIYVSVERVGDTLWFNMHDDSGDVIEVFTEATIRVLKELCEFILVTYTDDEQEQS